MEFRDPLAWICCQNALKLRFGKEGEHVAGMTGKFLRLYGKIEDRGRARFTDMTRGVSWKTIACAVVLAFSARAERLCPLIRISLSSAYPHRRQEPAPSGSRFRSIRSNRLSVWRRRSYFAGKSDTQRRGRPCFDPRCGDPGGTSGQL